MISHILNTVLYLPHLVLLHQVPHTAPLSVALLPPAQPPDPLVVTYDNAESIQLLHGDQLLKDAQPVHPP